MAEKLGFFSQWLGGNWAERNTINANADALESEARSVYEQVVASYGATKQAAAARQQLENLRGI